MATTTCMKVGSPEGQLAKSYIPTIPSLQTVTFQLFATLAGFRKVTFQISNVSPTCSKSLFQCVQRFVNFLTLFCQLAKHNFPTLSNVSATRNNRLSNTCVVLQRFAHFQKVTLHFLYQLFASPCSRLSLRRKLPNPWYPPNPVTRNRARDHLIAA